MTLPYREWHNLYIRSFEYNSVDNTTNTIDKWLDTRFTYGQIGAWNDGVAPKYHGWRALAKPSESDFELIDGLDHCIDCEISLGVSLYENSTGNSSARIFGGIQNTPAPPNQWLPWKCTGKYYDEVNPWGSYNLGSWQCTNYGSEIIAFADLPVHHIVYTAAYWAGALTHQCQDELFANGINFYLANYDSYSPFNDNEICRCMLDAYYIKVRYFNPIVNDISRYWMRPAGGVTLILTGLGFNQDDSEISDTNRYPVNQIPPGGWDSYVDRIDFIGLQGQGTTTLNQPADFTIVSDTEIRIDSMPALAAGSYYIKLRKVSPGMFNYLGAYPEGYAGDWRTESDGRVHSGDRFSFLVGAEYGEKDEKRGGGRPLLFIGLDLRAPDGEIITKYYAPIDVRSPEIFYDGRLMSISTLRRALDDRTGLYSVSDMEFELANNDKEFSKIMAQYLLKNQRIQVWHGWADEPEAWKTSLIKMYIDDYDLEGTSFKIKGKDITHKYFQRKIPFYRCEDWEYPNIDENSHGLAMPEVLGANELSGDNPGAVEAVYIDTVNHKYLAARRTLNSIGNVYSAGSLVNPADYVISYEDGGRTYITFDSDQGDNRITFDCSGYQRFGWNSANGYVQCPAYVIAYVLAEIIGIPAESFNWDSFDDMAVYFDDMGKQNNGRLILQAERDINEVLQELLFTYGVKLYLDNDGKLNLGRKDLSNWDCEFTIYEQIDLISSSYRPSNVKLAINYAAVKLDYYPSANVYTGAHRDYDLKSIEDFGMTELCPESPWNFPWINDEDWVVTRTAEEITKFAYGYRRIEFPLSIGWLRGEDLDIFANFCLQDPYAPSASGLGERQHYYYIDSLEYDFMNQKIRVGAIDLQWLLRKCMIIGRYADLTRNWEDASNWQRMFAYIGDCTTGRFPDGVPNKKICRCQGG